MLMCVRGVVVLADAPDGGCLALTEHLNIELPSPCVTSVLPLVAVPLLHEVKPTGRPGVSFVIAAPYNVQSLFTEVYVIASQTCPALVHAT